MPPKTRSQTACSRPPSCQPTSLATLEKGVRNLDIENDESGSESPVESSSSGYDLVVVRHGGIETHSTPRSRIKTSGVSRRQRTVTPNADPDGGCCLVTNRPTAVELCHIVSRAGDPALLTKLEYVWGMGYRQFNVDTKHNMMHLRADWGLLFDKGEWVLVPEYEDLQKLNKLYVEDKLVTSNMAEVFSHPTYRYYILPSPTLQEPVFRFQTTSIHDYKPYFPPFSDLGSLTSHVHPHFVVFDTGRKLASLGARSARMTLFLSQIVDSLNDAVTMLDIIQNLYAAWTEVQVPDEFYNVDGTPKRFNSLSEGRPPRRPGLVNAARSQGQGSMLPFTVVKDDTDLVEYIHNWQKQGVGAAERWEPDAFGDMKDEQLAAYLDEHARPPPPGAWDSWEPEWNGYRLQYST